MIQVGIYGASGFGREVMPLAEMHWADRDEPYELVFVDDHPAAAVINGHAVLTYSQFMRRPAISRYISIAISSSLIRKSLVERCIADGIKFFDVRANNIIQLCDVQIGEGSVLCPFVTLTSNIRIGRHFHANVYSYVAHDCVIGDYVTLAPGAICCGNVVVEDGVYIGAGAVIKQGHPGSPLVIGSGARLGMGAIVTKNVPPGVTVVGNPARLMVRD